MRRFENKTAVITGAASGMGFLTSKCFYEEGANVVMLDINKDALEKCAEEIKKSAGGKVLPVVTNVRSFEEIKNAVDTAKNEFGSVDITVSYAGGWAGRIFNEQCDFTGLSLEALEWGIDVNFRAPLYMAKCAIKYMKEQKSGVIVNIGSVDGVTGSGAADYSAAKSGLVGFTKSMALIGAPYGVRCCMVSPGPVLTRPAMANMKTALGRAAEPSEVVDLVMYLCSDKAAFITGDNYVIDGGRSCGGRN